MSQEDPQLGATHDVKGKTGGLPDIPKRKGLLARHLQRWKASLARVCWFLLLKLASSAVATCNPLAALPGPWCLCILSQNRNCHAIPPDHDDHGSGCQSAIPCNDILMCCICKAGGAYLELWYAVMYTCKVFPGTL